MTPAKPAIGDPAAGPPAGARSAAGAADGDPAAGQPPDVRSAAGQRAVAVAPSVLREMNQRLLLDQLFAGGPATRPRLARDAGLSLPTVIAALADLENAELVRPAGRADTAQGRPATRYEANPSAGLVVGVDVGRDRLRLAVADLAGNQLGQLELRNTARTSAALVEGISDAVASVARAAAVDPAAITHAVIGSPGVYDPRRGRVLYAANLPGWQRGGLAETLGQRLGTSLTVDNDANLAAIGEHNYGAGRGTRHFVYAHVDSGVGVGLVLDGKLYQGFSGAAGEVGYLPIGAPAAQPVSRVGMLEEQLASAAVLRYAREAGLSGCRTVEAVFAAARAGDQRAGQVIEVVAGHLARLIASIAAFLDPELIVLGGSIGRHLDLLEAPTRAVLAQLTPMSPRLAVGALGADAVVRGALATGVRRAREIVFAARSTRAS
ncbi:MAG: hypothetical protein QOH45_21 [Pseudonocardiales bacterium]|nr:hypothetical protein [Pseudonocardiales bacterium]